MELGIFAIIGFLLASYSVVGNDAIQTIGTFLASNQKKPKWMVWAYIAGILTFVLFYGYFTNGGDVSYGRLEKIQNVGIVEWWYLLPVASLLILTRIGIPVSTTFLVLSVFVSSGLVLKKIILKSLIGYLVAFVSGFILWAGLRKVEPHLIKSTGHYKSFWTAAQWGSTGFLWSMWLIQDFANLYVFLPRDFSPLILVLSWLVMVVMLWFIIKENGGKIQKIVRQKTNTSIIISATFIDLFYGLILYYFKTVNKLPMSTTWVFLGVLAGREMIIRLMNKDSVSLKSASKDIASDFAKATLGLVISLVVAYGAKAVFA